MILGVFVGLIGYFWVVCYVVVYVDIVGGFELEVVVVCVIGRILIVGGIGLVGGMLFGVLFFGIVKNVLLVINILFFW